MKEKLNISVSAPENLRSNEMITLLVELTNISGKRLTDVFIDLQSIPGFLIDSEQPENVEIELVEKKKNKIVKEMEAHAKRIFENKLLKELPLKDKIFAYSLHIFQFIVNLIMPFWARGIEKYIQKYVEEMTAAPKWAKEALSIDDFEDIENIEREIITNESNDSFLKKAFLIDKDKLKRIIKKLDEVKSNTTNDKLSTNFNIDPNSSIGFPFKIKLPTVFAPKDYFFQFNISFKEENTTSQVTISHKHKIQVESSPLLIGTAIIFGGLCGYTVKQLLIKGQTFSSFTIEEITGNVILSLIMALATVKTNNKNRSISAEDFLGGFMIGALTGLFTDSIIDKLKLLSKSI